MSHEPGDIYLTHPCHGEFSHKMLEQFNKYLYFLAVRRRNCKVKACKFKILQ